MRVVTVMVLHLGFRPVTASRTLDILKHHDLPKHTISGSFAGCRQRRSCSSSDTYVYLDRRSHIHYYAVYLLYHTNIHYRSTSR